MCCSIEACTETQHILSTFHKIKCEMAKGAPKNQDPFSCPICLDSLEDPVTIPCGHNYCMACIEDYWNEDKRSVSYSCPECKEIFTPRPALNKNIMFAEVVEQLKNARLQDSPPRNPGPASTLCSMCSGRKKQAVKICPDCVESDSGARTVRYKEPNVGEKHTIVIINKEPRMDICLLHNLALDIYCRTDRQLICSLCFTESHRNHDAVSLAPISTKGQESKSSHKDTQHGNKHGRRKCQRSRHESGHGSRHRSSSRNTLHLSGSHEVMQGSNMIRHGQVVGDGHITSTHRSRHGSWHMSSRHERQQH